MNEERTDWAILLYISADRALTNFAVESLKQLKRSAGGGIIALAQMEATGEGQARRYVFDGRTDPNSSIENDLQAPTDPAPLPGGIANPGNLTEFVKWASRHKEARHRCLFLWGHGYELLLNDDLTSVRQGAKNGGISANSFGEAQDGADPGTLATDRGGNDHGTAGHNYLAPRSLKQALESAKPFSGVLDIIGIDACCLCLAELASELGDCGDFLVASQEDVPDASFPYEEILLKLKDHDRDDVEGICTAIPKLYARAYEDYVIAPETGMKEVTLTSLRLKNLADITGPLRGLAATLLSSIADPAARKAVLGARQGARDFALGLFVDLRDFCFQLSARLPEGELKSACDSVSRAIDAGKRPDCIVANRASDGAETRCHGLSIYLPYLTEADLEQTTQLLMTATSTLDQVPLLVKGGTNHILKGRSVQISLIENDFESLPEFKKLGWSKFIKQGWSVILASEEPNELDRHYSGEQCAINLLSLWNASGRSASRGAAAANG
jgi:hypothetical protein